MRTGGVIVVGAGIGGLVAALELAHAGEEVLVLERGTAPGGKIRRVTVDGAAMDAGPTVFTMRWVLDELFDAVGTDLAAHLELHPLPVLARHAWNSAERLDLYADPARSADAIGNFAGAGAKRGFEAFCRRSAEIYRTLEQPFLRDSRPNPVSLAGRVALNGVGGLLRIAPFGSLWDELGRYFADPRLRQLFGRYATYCGSSPFAAPATLMLVAHVEQSGVWQVEGGMHGIAAAVARLAASHGARFRYGAHVQEIVAEGGRVGGIRLADGEFIAADAVVFNGDAAALAGGHLGTRARAAVSLPSPPQRSLSALTWNLHAPTSGFPLLHHNVFFSGDCATEFDEITRRGRLPHAPTVYVCAQDRQTGEAAAAALGAERLLCIVNAPATGDTLPFSDEELERCETRTFEHLQRCGLQVQPDARNSLLTTPTDFDRLYPATGGALYGQASHGWRASFQRPGARSALPGLYLAGGSVHPGPGVPMAALSGRQAAASLLADRPRLSRVPRSSTATSHATATPGGTSTR